jgi:hypothetical protein
MYRNSYICPYCDGSIWKMDDSSPYAEDNCPDCDTIVTPYESLDLDEEDD